MHTQSTFTQFAASTGRKADVLLQILVQAAALTRREAGKWRGMNSFLGTEKSDGGGGRGANRLTGDLFEGEVDWRVKPGQRERRKNVCSRRYVVVFHPFSLFDHSDGKRQQTQPAVECV